MFALMKQIIFTTVLALVFSVSAFAQTEKSPCPEIDVIGGGVIAKPGELMTFTTSVIGETVNLDLEYEWTVSQGTIVEGKGTSTIRVDAPDFPNIGLTATVEIKGLPENCANTASETMTYDLPPSPLLLDEFGKLSNGGVKARIDAIYAQIGNEPNSQAYIINYGTNKEIAARENQIRKAIVFRKFDASRVTIVRGGANPNGGVWTKIHSVPPGAENPQL